ncbi:MAG: serine/threonine-protein kinase [Polyangiales bacterium]
MSTEPFPQIIAGKYRVLACVGAGGMGVVYAAENLELGRLVALKVLPPELGASPAVAARFRREARAAARIQSEHVVQVFDVGTDPSCGLFLVMELLNGEDLCHRLARAGRLSPAVAAAIATQVGRGLARAHASGVIHRDLKPANVFLSTHDDGALHVRIVDFGIAKLVTELVESDRNVTRDGTLVGTASYMSPEHARGEPLDARTDIWALGAVLYEMLAGVPPYPEQHAPALTLLRIVNEPYAPLASIAPWTPTVLLDVVSQALERDVNLRTITAADIVERLQGFASEDSVSTLEVVETMPLHEDLAARATELETPAPFVASVVALPNVSPPQPSQSSPPFPVAASRTLPPPPRWASDAGVGMVRARSALSSRPPPPAILATLPSALATGVRVTTHSTERRVRAAAARDDSSSPDPPRPIVPPPSEAPGAMATDEPVRTTAVEFRADASRPGPANPSGSVAPIHPGTDYETPLLRARPTPARPGGDRWTQIAGLVVLLVLAWFAGRLGR